MIILTHEPPLPAGKAHSLAVGVCSSVAGACADDSVRRFVREGLLVGRGGVRRNYSYPDRLRYRFLYHSTSPESLLPGRSWFVRRARVHSTTIFS